MNNNLMTIKDINKQLNKSSSTTQANNIVEDLVKNIVGTQYSSLWIYDSSKSILFRTRENSTTQEISVQSKEGLLYRCFATQTTIVTNYLASEKDYVGKVDNPDNIKIKSKIMIPLIDEGVFLGIVTAYTSVSRMKIFSENDTELLNVIVPFVISAVNKINDLLKNKGLDVSSVADGRRTGSAADRRSTGSTINIRSTDNTSQLEDIKKLRANLQTSQEVLDHVANIVHDIRTPSNGLFGFLDILEEQIQDERLKGYISHAKESAQLINELTTSILDGVSTSREQSQTKNELVSPFKFFGNIANIFSATMYQKQISYNIYIDPLLPKEVEVESIKLKRIIMNLIGNANKFTPENKTIEFSVRYKQKDKKIHIFVKDSGIGIANEKQKEIFDAFTQAEDNTSSKYGGTGLGLAISAAYVKELGGKLCVDSELEKGSTFYFDIPVKVKCTELKFTPIHNKNIEIVALMKQKNIFIAGNIARYLAKMGTDKLLGTSRLSNVPSSATHIIVFEKMLNIEVSEFIKAKKLKMLVVEENFLSLEKVNLDGASLVSQYEYFAENLYTFIDEKNLPKVLIVDDDKISVDLVRVILEDELCKIDVAYNGEEGLDLLVNSIVNNSPYSIVYSDSNMPIMSGQEMLYKYKKQAKKRGIENVLTVSISGDICEKDNDSSEFDIYIGKPLKKEDIKSVFNESIQQRSYQL